MSFVNTILYLMMKNLFFILGIRNIFLFHVDTFQLSCHGKSEKMHEGCKACVFSLPLNCSLKYKDIYIPPTLGHGDENVTSGEIGHVLPIPLLKKIYVENSSFDQILATQALLPVAPVFNLQSFSYFHHEIQNELATLEKSKIPLQTAVSRMKADKTVLESIEQAFVTGEIKTVSLSFWTTIEGILLQTSLILTGLLVGLNVFFIFKIRAVTITLLLLQQHISDTSAQTQTVKPTPLEFNFYPKNAQNEEKHSIFSLDQLENKLEYFLILVIALAVCIYCIKRMLKKISKHFSFSLRSFVVIQCMYNGMTLYIKWIKLTDRPNEYIFEAAGPLKNLNVKGWFKPIIEFQFEGFRIIHKLTRVPQTPPTTFQISIFQAIILKYFLTRENNLFYFFPIHIFENDKFAMNISDTSVPTLEAPPTVDLNPSE